MGAFSLAFASAFDAESFTADLPLSLLVSPPVVKQRDVHSVVMTVQTRSGGAVDLTGSTVRVLAKPVTSGVTSVLAASLGAQVGTVIHGLDGNLAEGAYLVEVEATLAGGVFTAPTDAYASLRVMSDLA